MHPATQAILDYNQGRDPERLRLKFQALRRDPFPFFRGTAPLFYDTLPMPKSLKSAPLVLASGDLHLENFGSYKGDNRLVYFDINDFDEACLAPLTFDVTRFLASILVGASVLKFGGKDAAALVMSFMDAYAAALISGKTRWVERSTATGPVKDLLDGLMNRHRIDLIQQRTELKKGKLKLIIDSKFTLEAGKSDRATAEKILATYAKNLPDRSQ